MKKIFLFVFASLVFVCSNVYADDSNKTTKEQPTSRPTYVE